MADRRDVTDPVVLRVERGELRAEGSWVYVWVLPGAGRVLHVGATGLHPELRTWLHLHHPEPRVGRIAALHPGWREQDLRVVAVPVPRSLARATVRDALARRLAGLGLLDGSGADAAEAVAPSPEVDQLVDAVVDQVRALTGDVAG